MKAFPFSVAKALGNKNEIHFALPHFQREYRWGKDEWKKLWEDAMATYEVLPAVSGTKREPEHFLGAMVVIYDGKRHATVDVYRLVDGQQRLTTLSLLVCALGEAARKSQPTIYKKCRSLLVNEDEKGDLHLKLLPTTKNEDRAIYRALIEGKPLPDGTSRLPEAHHFFQKQIETHLDARTLNLEHLFQVVAASFQLVWVEFEPTENAHQIFESLNTTGQRLTQVDLVRNYIAMSLPLEKQDEVFSEVWSPLEKLLDNARKVGKSGLGELSAFLRHYDAMNSGHLPAADKIYARLRDELRDLTEHDFIEKLHEIKRFAGLYNQLLRPDKGTDKKLLEALEKLSGFDALTAYPFLMAVAARHEQKQISSAEFIQVCQVLENFFVRCFLTGIKSNAYDKVMASLPRKVDWNDILPSLHHVLIKNGYPSDGKVRQMLPPRNLYEAAPKEKIVKLFERINAAIYEKNDVSITVETPSLEHILPQNPSTQWSEDLGEDLNSIKNEWLHTIGNLTLVSGGYNASLSNAAFSEKREKLLSHGLRLNSDYFSQPIVKWDAETIQARATWLAEQILQIWPTFGEDKAAPKPVALSTPAPQAIIIRGQRLETKSWRDMMRQIAVFVGELQPNFFHLHSQMPSQVRQTPFNFAQHDWGNGWYLDLNHSAASTLRFASKLLQNAGVRDDEWEIEENGA